MCGCTCNSASNMVWWSSQLNLPQLLITQRSYGSLCATLQSSQPACGVWRQLCMEFGCCMVRWVSVLVSFDTVAIQCLGTGHRNFCLGLWQTVQPHQCCIQWHASRWIDNSSLTHEHVVQSRFFQATKKLHYNRMHEYLSGNCQGHHYCYDSKENKQLNKTKQVDSYDIFVFFWHLKPTVK